MNIQLLGISHRTAPASVRALFAFTEAQREALSRALLAEDGIAECVVLATCNRTEVYTVSEPSVPTRRVMAAMQRQILAAVDLGNDVDGAGLLRFYMDTQAVRHLFQVAAGLDSMVMGEDQILGQVGEAHREAMEKGFSGPYANALFRMAVTAAKRVKTETKLSAVSVSTATLAVRAAGEYLGSLDGKTVLLIGATGKIGQIIMKNLFSDHKVNLYGTSRQIESGQSRSVSTAKFSDNHCSTSHYATASYEAIAYEQRYAYADAADLVISATASPHYTLTKERWQAAARTPKPRILIDMAVPMDIEAGIDDGHLTRVCHLDELSALADKNQHIRQEAALRAREMLEEDMAQFERWKLFQENLPLMRSVRDRIMSDMGEAASAKGIEKLFYRVRENAGPEQLKVFFEVLAQSQTE